MEKIPEALAWYVAFLFSVTFHEASHAWVAKWGGDLTAYRGGQVSINPFPHIRREPLGMLLIPLISVLTFGWPFGYASTPYDPVWARHYPKRSALMSLAGPLANFSLVLLMFALIRTGLLTGFFEAPMRLSMAHVVDAKAGGYWQSAAMLISMFFSLNLILGFFNLIPLPPLDGSGILPLFLSHSMANYYNRFVNQPMFGLMGLFLAWRVFDPMFRPIFDFAIRLLYPDFHYS